ncbi:DNA ligase [Streptomyces canus]|uniref:ATP-dependent DNA ligase n=1 Tax=Streptomyces canus TaxID=58343 RepID=UPI0036BA866B
MKLDGHRTVLWRLADTVRLQTRSGRDVTASWMDLALAGMGLPPGVVLDGEAVIVVDGVISFAAAQSRAASSPARARRLSEEYPALFIVWDVLQLPAGDVRGRPYTERRAMLLDVLAGLPSPSSIQAVSATDDPEVARAWYDSLQPTGVEGVVAKLATSPYRAGRSSSWKKVRHAETVDAEVVGLTGTPSRPRALAVRLPDGRTALSQRLGAPLAAQASVYLRGAPAGGLGLRRVTPMWRLRWA